jgi:hypothetical protein
MPRTDRTPSGEPASEAEATATLPAPHRPSRREFLWALGAASTLPLASAATGWAQPPPAPPGSSPPAATPPPDTDPAKAADAADARSLLEIVERRFGSRLDAAQMESVRRDLEDNMRAARTLRALQLTNADEPDVVFRAVIREAR